MMMKMGNPGALAGATGAKKSIHATAEDLFLIPQDKAKHHNSSVPLEVALCGKSASHAMVKWRTKSAASAFGGPGSENFTLRKIHVETITWPHTDSFRGNQRLQILCLIVATNAKEERGYQIADPLFATLSRLARSANEQLGHHDFGEQTMTDARDLTNALGGKWYQSYGVAPCPVCQPRRDKCQNALTLAYGRNGYLILHCKKSDCAFTDILAASGLRPGGYTPPDAETLARREAEQRDYAKRRAMQAAQLWKEAKPINGTPAETYLRGRGISCPLPDTLRFHPECWHGPTAKRYPAMVALVTGGNGAAIHRTYLAPDGRGKAALTPPKAMLGATKGGAVRLAKEPGPLLVGEGIESSFSALILHGDKTATAFAALSTSGMRGLRLPSVGRVGKVERCCPRLIIAVDGEKAGRDAGRELAERAAGLGWQVSILDPGDGVDFNDRLIEGTRHEHI